MDFDERSAIRSHGEGAFVLRVHDWAGALQHDGEDLLTWCVHALTSRASRETPPVVDGSTDDRSLPVVGIRFESTLPQQIHVEHGVRADAEPADRSTRSDKRRGCGRNAGLGPRTTQGSGARTVRGSTRSRPES